MVERLKVALEDLTAVCILEGFQKQDHLMLVDTLGKPFDHKRWFDSTTFHGEFQTQSAKVFGMP